MITILSCKLTSSFPGNMEDLRDVMPEGSLTGPCEGCESGVYIDPDQALAMGVSADHDIPGVDDLLVLCTVCHSDPAIIKRLMKTVSRTMRLE